MKFNLVKFESQNLSNKSEIEICKKLWTHCHIKNSIKSKLQHYDTNVNQPEILHQVFQNIDKVQIPSGMTNDLKRLAEKMGYVISTWLNDIYNRGYLPVDMGTFLDYIEWTDIGDIDTAETVRSMYFSGIFPDYKNTWIWLTSNCLEDCIEDYVGKSEYLKTRPELRGVLQIYWRRKIENKLEDFLPDLEVCYRPNGALDHYPQSESGIMSLLPIYIIVCNTRAVKYFWKFLTDDQRIVYIQSFISLNDTPWQQNVNTQIVRFIYYQALSYGKKFNCLDVMTNVTLLKSMSYWPYDDFFMRSLEKYWPYFEQRHYKSIATHCKNTGPNQKRLLFWNAWQQLDGTDKNDLVEDRLIGRHAKDVNIMNYIINDPELISKRRDLILVVGNYYRRECSSTESNFREAVEEFCKVVLKTEDERQNFRHHKITFTYVPYPL